MAKYRSSPVLLCFGLCFLVLSQVSQGYRQGPRRKQPWRIGEEKGTCQFQSLTAREPSQRIQHEAGVTELWEEDNEQMQCASVAVTRHTIEPNGLLLPTFTNAPMLVYIVQGRGVLGTMIPGCPETYESFQRTPGGRRMRRIRAGETTPMEDLHQKLRYYRQGDLVALPAGVAHWCYNDGETPLTMVVFHDRFFLAGNPLAQAQQQRHTTVGRERRLQSRIGNNVFRGFDIGLLAEAFGVSEDVARQLQCENDPRGAIIRVHEGLRMVRPPATMRRGWGGNNSTDENVEEYYENDEAVMQENGMEETICAMRLTENLEDPERADVYTVRGGRIRTVTSFDLPVLKHLQLSAKRGYLYKNAMVAPQWNMNSHEILYCIRGRARVQVVGCGSTTNRPVFDGEVREGQLLVIPQNYVSLARAGEEGFEWITFMTSDNAMFSPLAGRVSVMRGIPEEVLMNMFMISREDAQRLKYNRPEMTILSPRSTTRGIRASA
ncbi:hypothetical protein Cgig2_018998 [Carnegiea gigantea]|uniref:Cupin type-1 domain-containing protein n=1 Tax=Carnegiea gigantea TaxID=171969 RepID=A0A9Q1GTI9_9CARY|nr:hypothetical protein Cgig2_018998 [Carnegiea gigantea]